MRLGREYRDKSPISCGVESVLLLTRRKQILFAGLALLLMKSDPVVADDVARQEAVPCKLTVRVINAHSKTAISPGMRLEAGRYLHDVKDQLQPLPYASYKVVDSAEKTARIGEQVEFAVFNHGDMHRLLIQPLRIQGVRYSEGKFADLSRELSDQQERIEGEPAGNPAQGLEPSAGRETVQVMVDWTGPGDEDLLNTKLEIVNGKNVVVGTDTGIDTSAILCIRVQCATGVAG